MKKYINVQIVTILVIIKVNRNCVFAYYNILDVNLNILMCLISILYS